MWYYSFAKNLQNADASCPDKVPKSVSGVTGGSKNNLKFKSPLSLSSHAIIISWSEFSSINITLHAFIISK